MDKVTIAKIKNMSNTFKANEFDIYADWLQKLAAKLDDQMKYSNSKKLNVIQQSENQDN